MLFLRIYIIFYCTLEKIFKSTIKKIVISCATLIILSMTINPFLKIDERSIIRIRKALENRTNMEDDRVSLLEQQLAQAKLIAEEADKKYEEVGHQRTKSEKK